MLDLLPRLLLLRLDLWPRLLPVGARTVAAAATTAAVAKSDAAAAVAANVPVPRLASRPPQQLPRIGSWVFHQPLSPLSAPARGLRCALRDASAAPRAARRLRSTSAPTPPACSCRRATLRRYGTRAVWACAWDRLAVQWSLTPTRSLRGSLAPVRTRRYRPLRHHRPTRSTARQVGSARRSSSAPCSAAWHCSHWP